MRLFAVCLAALAAAVFAAPAAAQSGSGKPVGGRYIVVLKNSIQDVNGAIARRERRDGFRSSLRYKAALKGFAARLSADQRKRLRNDPNVVSITPDRPVHATTDVALASGEPVPPPGIRRIGAASTTTARQASTANVAVIDTGIQLTHPDLNAVAGKSCINSFFGTTSPNDDNGHGTHVSGTIAARNNGSGVVGIAPNTKLYAVKVLNSNGSGSTSQVICGIDWVTANASALNIKVANMSLGGGGPAVQPCPASNDPEHAAICRSVAAGVTYVVAAGNDTTDFDDATAPALPAAFPEVLTVSAITDTNGTGGGGGPAPTCISGNSDDTRASFSNFAATSAGAAHLIAAPGICVTSTWLNSGYRTISGTSMATPHVTGAVALCLGDGGTPGPCAGMTPAQIIQKLRSDAQTAKQNTPSYGFVGDPLNPFAGRTYGYLASVAAPAPPPPPVAPTATVGPTTDITQTSATLNGTVNPGGDTTSWQFRYSTDLSYSSLGPSGSAGSGRSDVPVSGPLTGLQPDTTYHFELIAVSPTGPVVPAEGTFRTLATPPPVTTQTKVPSAVAIDAGSLRAGTAGALAATDSALYQVNSASSGFLTKTASWYGRFTSVPTSLSNLKVAYTGRMSTSCSQTVAIQRVSDGAWVALDTRSVGNADVAIANLAPAGAASQYVTAGGELRVRVRCSLTSFSSFFSSGNFMQITYDA